MAGDGFLLGEPVDLGLAEVAVQAAQSLLVRIRQRRCAEQRVIGECDQPLRFGLDAGTVEAGFGEEFAQWGDGRAITPVEGAQRLDGEGVRESQGSPPDRAPQVRGDVRL